MSELSPPQAESSSWSSSFWVDSALVAGLPDEAEEEEHALNLKQVDLQPEGVLENMVNIPPSLTNNTRVGAVQPVKIVPSKFSGMQCQEDVEKFQEDTEGRGYAYGIVGNDDNHIQDPHETQRKSVYVGDNSDARESNVQNSKQVTYFEISPLDVLGMSKDTHKTTSSYASVQNGAYDAEDEITDASDRYSEGFSLPNIKVKIGNIDALNVTEAAGISSPTASDHTAEEEALGNEYVSHAPQTAGEAEAETMSSSPSNTDGDEDQSDALEEEISDEENPNENLGANEEAGTIFTAPLRAAAMVVNGVRAVLRATHGYWNYNRTN